MAAADARWDAIADLVDVVERGVDDVHVGARAAAQDIVPRIRTQHVAHVVAGQRVVTRAGSCILDHHAAGDGHVVHQTADVGIGQLDKRDFLVGGEIREVDRVDAVRIVDGEGDGIAPVAIRRAGNVARPLVQQLLKIAADVRAVAVDRVAAVGDTRNAVEVLDGDDVGGHERGRKGETVGRREGVILLAEIGHDRRQPAVVLEEVVLSESRVAVVVSGVAEVESMTDLVHVGLQHVAVQIQ